DGLGPAVLRGAHEILEAPLDGSGKLRIAQIGDDLVIEIVDRGRARQQLARERHDRRNNDGTGVQECDSSHDQPFTDPAAMPAMIFLLRKMNTISSAMMLMLTDAK